MTPRRSLGRLTHPFDRAVIGGVVGTTAPGVGLAHVDVTPSGRTLPGMTSTLVVLPLVALPLDATGGR